MLPHGTQCMGVQDQEVAAPVEVEVVEAVAQVVVVADQEEVVVALQVVALEEVVQQEELVEGAMVG